MKSANLLGSGSNKEGSANPESKAMKKTTILILFLTCSGITFGQTLIDTTKTWNSLECMNFGPCRTYAYKFEGDTTFNGIQYEKLVVSGSPTDTTWSYRAAFREDTEGKVYRYAGSEEVLYYNFDLEVGDDFVLDMYGISHTMTVEQVDSVSLLNGEMRKRIRFDDFAFEDWIEGIGSSYGLPFVGVFHHKVDVYYELNCFFVDGELQYQPGSYDDCWYNTLGVEESHLEEVCMVSPNPFINTCTIAFDQNLPGDYEVRVVDIRGAEVETYSQNSPEMEIGENLNSGLYIIQVFERGVPKQIEKVVKE